MNKRCEGNVDSNGNLSFSWAFRIAGAIIALLVSVILAIFGFVGSKALASMESQEIRTQALEIDVNGINVKLDYIIKWIDKQKGGI